MRVMVTGAAGFIGSALIEYLINIPSVSVVGMIRSMKKIDINKNIEYRLGEIGSSNIINLDLSDIDVIVHTAGRAHILSESFAKSLEEFRRVNTFGTINLAQLAADSGVKRFIFLSSIKVNGESTSLGAPFSNNSTENPRDSYGISKYEAEVGLLKLSNETDMQFTIIRPPLVYGPYVKGNFNTLLKVMNFYIPLPLASIKNNRRSMVGIDNLISMIEVCLTHPKAANQTFLISDNSDLSTFSLLKLLGESIDRPAILFKFPLSMLALIAKLFRMEAKVQKIIGSLQVDISHTCIQLDWEPSFSVKYGLERLKKKIK